MPRQFPHVPDDRREPHEIEWEGFGRFYAIALGIAALIGLACGLLWTIWHLLRLHVFE
jgi:hypothetical protein